MTAKIFLQQLCDNENMPLSDEGDIQKGSPPFLLYNFKNSIIAPSIFCHADINSLESIKSYWEAIKFASAGHKSNLCQVSPNDECPELNFMGNSSKLIG